MPQGEFSTWLGFALQQMAAESYLEGISLSNADQITDRLLLGNNRDGFPLTGFTRFTGTRESGQARDFTSRYQVVDHHANDATGFSATLLKDTTTDSYTLSFRSTEYRNLSEGGDFERDGQPGADGEIFFKGFAFGQLVSMEKYYQQLKTDGLLPNGATLNVTGYSLGGHLATVFTEMHETDVNHTYTFNGAGRGQLSGGTPGLSEGARIKEMVDFFADQLSSQGLDSHPFDSGTSGSLYTDFRYQTALQAVFDQYHPTSQALSDIPRTDGPFSKITQLVGHANHEDTDYVANSGVHRAETSVFIEGQPILDGFGGFFGLNGSFGTTHSFTLLIDSLALSELFQSIDPNLTKGDIEKIFGASSDQRASGTTIGTTGIAEGNSLENALDGLGRIFVSNHTPTPFGRQTNDFGDLTFRSQFYANLEAVRSAVGTQTYQIISLATMSSNEIYAAARNADATGMAYRFALQDLNPFAVIGADYTQHNVNGAVDLYNAQIGQGTWTLNALSDRAELLAETLKFTRADGTPGDASVTLYEDKSTLFNNGRNATATEVVTFGGTENDPLDGRLGNDHLYGGAGDDVLNGLAGQDYLEGGVDNDELHGGSENDILLGQQGDDQLYGGADNDRLNGGLGNDLLDGGTGLDTHVYHSGQGQDRIVDSDKVGTIQFDNQTLVGGIRRQGDPASTYGSADGRFTYVKSGADLVINGTLAVENFNFSTGALGIKLADAGNLVDNAGPVIEYNNGQPTVTYDGDATDNTPTFTASANHVARGFGGNDVLDLESSSSAFNHQIYGGDGHDELHGGAGHDRIYGEAGRDLILAVEGDDVLDGGGEIDLIKGGLGQDVLYGGPGNDGLDGGSGDDVVWGGDGNDVLSGESIALGSTTTGDDYLDGEAGDDWVLGLRGDDVLYGGTGADHLYGDQVSSNAPNFELTYPGIVTTLPGQAFNSLTGGADYLDGGEGADYLQGDAGDDVLLGGEDNDELVGDDLQVGIIQEGDDWLEGEGGNDTLIGGGGEDALYGGDGDDVLVGDYANNVGLGFDDLLDGGAGADELQGGGGEDLVLGGSDNDRLFGEAGDDILDGEQGADELQGGDGDDLLNGGTEHDRLFGQGGADDLAGGTGDDLLSGGDGDDFLDGEDGADQVVGGAGQDLLVGGVGDDTLSGESGDDELIGDEGEDIVDGGEGNDLLVGGGGNDQLFGGSGSDELDGGTGNDQLSGRLGADTYMFNLGDGVDTISDTSGEGNKLVFGPGITSQDITLGLGSLMLRVGSNGGTIYIQGFNPADPTQSAGIDVFEFTDGTTLTHAELVARGFDLVGTSGNDVLNGGESYQRIVGLAGHDGLFGGSGDNVLEGGTGNDQLFAGVGADLLLGGEGNDWLDGGEGPDTFDGGADNDRLEGGSGNDTYRFSLGSGVDQIVEFAGSSDANQVVFGPGITATGMQYRLGNGLELPIGTQGDGLSLDFPNFSDIYNSRAVDEFQFSDGTTLTHAQLVDRGINVPGTEFDDTLFGTNARDLFIGGRGNDRMNGGAGDDQYTFVTGDGIDTIEDLAKTGQGNSVVFGAGMAPADLTLGWQAPAFGFGTNQMLIRVGTSGDTLLLESFDRGNVLGPHAVDSYRFSDGTVLTYDQLIARGFDLTGTVGNDVVAGTNVTDRLKGLAGNDTLQGGAGDDVLDGGTGDDLLNGSRGDDTYLLGRGSGQDRLIDVGGTNDAIQYAADVTPTDLQVTRNGEDVVLTIGDSHDAVTLSQFFTAAVLQLDAVRFADGTVWDTATIAELARRPIIGTADSDNLTGTVGDDLFQGLAGDDQLSGLAGNDFLDGGIGADVMVGGTGDDTYLVDDSGDVVTELANEGLDTVQSAVSIQLSDNVENLTLTGTATVTGVGNELDNVLTGNSGVNVLTGGVGDDTYFIGLGDTVVEQAGEGRDTVVTDRTSTLGANLENLTLTGSAPIDGTGNDLDNVLTGNSAVNVLTGGRGNDTYVVSAGDIVMERAGEGIDTIQTTRSYQLGVNVENLTLLETARNIDPFLQIGRDAGEAIATSIYGGTGAGLQVGIGNALDNVLLGNSQRNVLEGGLGSDTLAGNEGFDVLRGGAGQDAYLFGFGSGIDAVDDVVAGEIDTIQVNAGITPDQTTVTRRQLDDSESLAYGNRFGLSGLFLSLPSFSSNQESPSDHLILLYSSLSDLSTKQVRFADGTIWDAAMLSEKSAGVHDPGPGVILDGGISDDVLIGTAANDRLNGFGGNDRLEGGAGNDLLDGGEGSDVLLGGDGRDSLSGGGGDNELDGGDGDDNVSALGGQNILRGGAGNDFLGGQGLVNFLDGGAGNDNLFGLGIDTFVFGRGYGCDSANPSVEDTVQLGPDVLPADVRLYAFESGNHRLGIVGTLDELQMGLSFPGQIVFADGTVWDQAYLTSHEQQGAGTDGNDTMGGTSGADTLVGGKGDDLYGVGAGDIVVEFPNEGNDTVTTFLDYSLSGNVENLLFDIGSQAVLGIGNELDNVIMGAPDHGGGDGDNILDGGAGNDVLIGGASIPSFTEFGDGSDVLVGGQGNDVLRPFLWMLGGPPFSSVGAHGVDLLLGGPGDDTYILIGGYEVLSAVDPTQGPFFDLPNATVVELPDEGSDTVVAITDQILPNNVDNLLLFGGTHGVGNNLDNVLIGSIGANILEGHAGNDTLIGGYGRILSPNGFEFIDPATVLDDSINDTAIDMLIGGVGDDVYVVGVGDIIMESAGEGTDRVISRASYQLGDHLEHLMLAGDEAIDGRGNGLDNRLTGNSAENVLAGGRGDDALLGGGGGDTYAFNLGDGVDRIEDTASAGEGNRILFGAGIQLGDLTFTQDQTARTLTIQVGRSGLDKAVLTNFDPTATNGSLVVNTLVFGDGSTTSLAELFPSNVNHAPTVANPLADEVVQEDTPFNVVVPEDTFADPDAGDHLTLSASLANRGALPTWLSFDASTGMFIGTPTNGDVGSLEVKVTATDAENLSVSDSFSLTVENVNDAPTVANLISDQQATQGAAYSFVVPANTFSDPDAGEVLTYSARLTNGNPLPTWLNFNSINRTFSGTPGSADVGRLNLTVTATDTGSLSAADDFTVTVSSADQILTGTAGNDVLTGGIGNDQLSGLAGNDTLMGGAGNDLLDGGPGADRLTGGTGNDTYVVESAGDVVTENANEGTDTVQSSITYTLGANVENLTLTGTANISVTGNALDNVLVGNSGNNTLTGGAGNDRLDGGLGNDTMVGGAGDDTFVVNQTGDVVTESANQGIDTVESAVTYNLGSNVEYLTLTGAANINGTGSSANNNLIGNSGNNQLDGGSGNDSLDGGGGNDTLLGGSGDDTLFGGLGNDNLNAGSGDDVLDGGDGTDTLDGGSGNDILRGGAGNDSLAGGSGADQFTGGTGNDTLTGGSGNDRYTFARGDGHDTIVDSDPFQSNQDHLLFDAAITPLDLVLSRQANDLRLAVHGSSDSISIQNWYTSPTTNQIEDIQAGHGQHLVNTQVDQLIQAMAGFSQQTGLTWDQAIDQQPQQVQTVLAANWH